ncbi:glutathione-disulfide reductase [Acetobacter cerevisiae]|uniref:Glutathione reductase n=1 Tax=Acetobacter cerevisiae TaxID=178900 RepID=A0A149UWK5_9PROT|nr:glutathione-disulfide reductase [Acetobacter cerevisiae]KXV72339.1 glutathione reductase [Acetobacter cerevisiae]MCP1244758.1 glutathione-disulfide reductase [Acetobacter cerevisiae]MCP1254335.1 glutathione-disulfide reductase [Acetobacter cerevisiae]
MTHEFDLLVIGAGSGGVRCARIAAGHGARVAVVESRHWGGTCVNLGCVPKKLMVQASEYGDLVDDSHAFGWSSTRGTHDWATLIAAKDKEITRLNGIYVSMLEKAGITLLTGHARFVDAHTVRVEASPLAPHEAPRTVTAKNIVIATGSTPLRPDIPGAELAITSDEAFHLPSRPQRVVIVGGGYIGLEFAGIFAGLGSQVDLVYRQALPLRGFDEDMRAAMAEAITVRGITQHPRCSSSRVTKEGETYTVTLDNGHTLEADCVFFATGRKPKIEKLGLENTGIAVGDLGQIKVDANSQTTEPGVYAIGDVTDRINLTPVAIAEGHNLADRLFGNAPPREWSFDTTPKAVFFSPPMASVGLTETEATHHGAVDIYFTRFTPMRHTLSGRKERKTVMKLVVQQSSQIVVGAHILGDDAPEMLQGVAVAVTAGLTKQDFDRTIGIHPTSAEELVTMRTRTRETPAAS